MTRLTGIAVVVASVLVIGACPAVAASRGMTHKVTISGEFVNHWTTSSKPECSALGDGTVTVRFRTSSATRVRPYRYNYRPGNWTVSIPHGRNLQGMKDVKAPGTITRVDNTTPRPFPEGSCTPSSRLGCGTFPLADKPVAHVNGYGNRHIEVYFSNEFREGPECLIGEAQSWGGPKAVVGGGPEGQFLIKMPPESAFKRRRVVRLTGSTHRRSRFSDGPLDIGTNDLTRKATVTFTRL